MQMMIRTASFKFRHQQTRMPFKRNQKYSVKTARFRKGKVGTLTGCAWSAQAKINISKFDILCLIS